MVNSLPSSDRPGAASRGSKRERLVAAARDLFLARGVSGSSLADIAGAADVPLGNVYYYFKSKSELIDAVVASRVDELASGTAELEREHAEPQERLKAWFREVAGFSDSIARYGCPYGTLSTELGKADPDGSGRPLLGAPLAWAERQFEQMGRPDAHRLALELLMAYQGAAVLAHALGTPELLAEESSRVATWLDALATGSAPG